MINYGVVPFPLLFLRFRHTGTDIYDVKNDTSVYDVKKLDFRIKRSCGTRSTSSQELQRVLHKVDLHHDTKPMVSLYRSVHCENGITVVLLS